VRRALVLAALLAGCHTDEACRPGTLFLHVTLDGLPANVDTLHAEVTVDGNTLTSDLPFKPGSGIELTFDQYPAGKTVDVKLEALAGGAIVASAEQTNYVLPPSCGAISFALGGEDLGAGGGGPDLTSGFDLPPNQPNGSMCSSPSQCQSTFCVDGYCCNSGCAGACEACDVSGSPGVCSAVADGDQPHGSRTKCVGNGTACGGACKAPVRSVCTFPGSSTNCVAQACAAGVKTLAGGCDGAGSCPTAQTFNCPTGTCVGNDCEGACTKDQDCTTQVGKPYCNLPQGVCMATKGVAATCAAGSECTSTFCTDGVCCKVACTSQCQACNLTGNVGSCATVSTGAPVTGSGTTRAACTGSGMCAGKCDGTFPDKCDEPGASTTCGNPVCSNGVRTPSPVCDGAGNCPAASPAACPSNQCASNGMDCLPRCNVDGDCTTANTWCNNGICQPKKSNGGGCNADDQCVSAHCVTGICCATTCSGTTPACKSDGSACACASSPDSCTATMGAQWTCGASGACVCAPACSGKVCGPDGCGASCGPGCSGTTPMCNASGTCECSGSSCSTMGAQWSCNASGQCVCTPITMCTAVPATCGTPSDGCSSTLSCGNCPPTTPDCNASYNCACNATSCSGLGSQYSCNTTTGQCQCNPNCPLGCSSGSDGCGGTCGCGTGKKCCTDVGGGPGLCTSTLNTCCSDTVNGTWFCSSTTPCCTVMGTCSAKFGSPPHC
jgi:hypothetical protein